MGGRNNFKVIGDGSWQSMGGYMTAKIQKLDQQFQDKSSNSSHLSSIFNNIAIFVNGYTTPTNDELKNLMAQHGGKFHSYYSRSSTTHVIASNLPHVKLKELRPNQNIVQPQWITDSIEAGKLLPVHPYLLLVNKASKDQSFLNKFVKKADQSSDSPSIQSNANEDSSYKIAPMSVHQPSSSATTGPSIVPTTDSTFLSDFYSHSRLHFLSTWKSELVDYVRILTTSEAYQLDGLKALQKMTTTNTDHQLVTGDRFITHIDMDCFFVSVGLLSRPHLQGKPLAVTHHQTNTPSRNVKRPGTEADFECNFYHNKINKTESLLKSDPRQTSELAASNLVPSYSEIASCNYIARKSGLKNGMFYGKAKELCPDLVAIPYDFDAYRQTSQKLYDILTSYTRDIEAVSCDEALLDITEVVTNTKLEPSVIVQHIRSRIKDETGCNASAGIGPNILLAKMATTVGKPNGQHHVTADQVDSFIQDHNVKNLPGVGSSTAYQLEQLGVFTCGDLQKISLDILKKEFGNKSGQKLYDFSKGIDNRKVCSAKERKSVSADVNYGIRLATEDELKTFLTNLTKEVSNRLKKIHSLAKKVTVKVMVRHPDAPVDTAKFGGHGVCRSLSKSKTMDTFTDDDVIIRDEVVRLAASLQVDISDLRGIGIQMTQLSSVSSKQTTTTTSIRNFVKLKTTAKSDAIDLTSQTTDQQGSTSKIVDNDAMKTKATDSPKCEISSSFLEALPDDLRDEVTTHWKAHQTMLKSKEFSSTSPLKILSSRQSPLKSKPSKAVRFKKSPGKRKRIPAHSKSANNSPNKLITDLFPVITKSSSAGADNPAHIVRRKLIENPGPSRKSETTELSTEDCSSLDSEPMLGNARTISESRDTIRQWTRSFTSVPPENDDIAEVTKYLCELVQKSRDLEGACLVLNTLRRSVLNLIDDLDVVDTQINIEEQMNSWIALYNGIASSLVEVVKEVYNGVLLNVNFIS